MPNPYKDHLQYYEKVSRMIERYEQYNQFYIFTGVGNGGKSINHIKSILQDPKLAPYDSDNDEPAN